MARKPHKLKNSVIYGALSLASGFARRLSLPTARSLGAMVGGVAHAVLGRERRKALRHLAMAFPEMPEARRSDIASSMFRHLGESLFEIGWMPNLGANNLHELTVFDGVENMQAAVDSGRGVVLFTGHCGNWEWMAASIGLLGFSMSVIAREIYDPRINEFVVVSRARHDVRTIGRGSAASAKEMLQTLRRGEILGVLIDQSLRAESGNVPFFGIPAPTPIGPARMAIRSGAMAIAGFIERRDGMQYVRFEAPIETSRDDDAVELTARLTKSIEDQIRRAPEQWVWMHERWKLR
ncbi:MAG: lysophospholipid acyltransferase family protein [Thermoanaerobaculia bacterium]